MLLDRIREMPLSDNGRVTLTTEMSELARANIRLGEWATRHRLPDRVVFAMRLCLEEVLANLVMHAFPGGTGEISIAFDRDATTARMTVIDGGIPFNPVTAESPVHGDSLVEAEAGGRGLMLVKRYACALAYARDENRNRLVLTFTL